MGGPKTTDVDKDAMTDVAHKIADGLQALQEQAHKLTTLSKAVSDVENPVNALGSSGPAVDPRIQGDVTATRAKLQTAISAALDATDTQQRTADKLAGALKDLVTGTTKADEDARKKIDALLASPPTKKPLEDRLDDVLGESGEGDEGDPPAGDEGDPPAGEGTGGRLDRTDDGSAPQAPPGNGNAPAPDPEPEPEPDPEPEPEPEPDPAPRYTNPPPTPTPKAPGIPV